MFPRTLIAFVNHLLRQQSWARGRLAEHSGGHICLRAHTRMADINFSITSEGLIAAEPGVSSPDLLISLRPGAVALLLRRHPDAMKNVELLGNAALASAIQDLFSRLEWDLEEDLSMFVGDIAANRLARAGRGLIAWQRAAVERSAQNFAEYWTEERRLFGQRAEFSQFRQDLQTLEGELGGLEARIEALARRARASSN